MATRVVERHCGNHPVRDALMAEAIMFVVLAIDWRNGIRGDPCRCAIALAIRRALNLPKTVDCGLAILKQTAYVPVPDDSSPTGYVILRYMVTDLIHRLWDANGSAEPTTVKLMPPKRSQRLEAQRNRSVEYRQTGMPAKRNRKFTRPGLNPRVRGGLYNHHSTN